MDQGPREPNEAGKGVLGASASRTESLPSVQLLGYRLLPACLSQCVGVVVEGGWGEGGGGCPWTSAWEFNFFSLSTPKPNC